MNLLDIQTIVFSYVITNAICLAVMAFLWLRNRSRFGGLGFWLADFVIQFVVIFLIALRGIVPDFLWIVASNTLVMVGTILLYIGLECFVGKRNSQVHNYLFLTLFISIHSYFTFVQPSLLIRTINLSVGIIFLCSQCAWPLIYRVDVDMRPVTRQVGYIFLAFCFFSLLHILLVLVVDPGNDFFQSGLWEALAVLIDQMLFMILTFGLLLMVNRRLVLDNTQLYVQLRSELAERKKIEENLLESRENFQRYFNVSTVGMCVTAPDLRWIETNGRLRQMLGYAAEELDNLTWSEITHPDDRDADLALYNQLLANERDSYQLDKRFIRKDGAIVYTTVFVSCYRNPDGSVRYCLASLVDITDHTLARESLLKLAAIEERQRLARDLHDSVNQSIHGLLLFSETLVSTLEKNNVDRARQIADRLQESARQALKETRLMLYEMQTADPERSVNLVQDLETRLVTVERRAGVKAQILQEGSMDHCPPAWHENLFWITIEALNNALKHAQARNMQIKIRCSSQRLELEIVDDGIGFDADKPRVGGLGLQNMRDRASLLGGELIIFSAPKNGSCVRFSAEIKE